METYTIVLSGEYRAPGGYTCREEFAEFSTRAIDRYAASLMGAAFAGTIKSSIYSSISWSVRDE